MHQRINRVAARLQVGSHTAGRRTASDDSVICGYERRLRETTSENNIHLHRNPRFYSILEDLCVEMDIVNIVSCTPGLVDTVNRVFNAFISDGAAMKQV